MGEDVSRQTRRFPQPLTYGKGTQRGMAGIRPHRRRPTVVNPSSKISNICTNRLETAERRTTPVRCHPYAPTHFGLYVDFPIKMFSMFNHSITYYDIVCPTLFKNIFSLSCPIEEKVVQKL